jgi:hypothetical protein
MSDFYGPVAVQPAYDIEKKEFVLQRIVERHRGGAVSITDLAPGRAYLAFGTILSLKTVVLAGAAAGALALSGCQTTGPNAGQLSAATQTQITAAFNTICPNIAALAPVAAQMNAKAQSAYASAQQLCAAGTPTNAVVAGLDIVTIMNSAVLQPYLAKIKIH